MFVQVHLRRLFLETVALLAGLSLGSAWAQETWEDAPPFDEDTPYGPAMITDPWRGVILLPLWAEPSLEGLAPLIENHLINDLMGRESFDLKAGPVVATWWDEQGGGCLDREDCRRSAYERLEAVLVASPRLEQAGGGQHISVRMISLLDESMDETRQIELDAENLQGMASELALWMDQALEEVGRLGIEDRVEFGEEDPEEPQGHDDQDDLWGPSQDKGPSWAKAHAQGVGALEYRRWKHSGSTWEQWQDIRFELPKHLFLAGSLGYRVGGVRPVHYDVTYFNQGQRPGESWGFDSVLAGALAVDLGVQGLLWFGKRIGLVVAFDLGVIQRYVQWDRVETPGGTRKNTQRTTADGDPFLGDEPRTVPEYTIGLGPRLGISRKGPTLGYVDLRPVVSIIPGDEVGDEHSNYTYAPIPTIARLSLEVAPGFQYLWPGGIYLSVAVPVRIHLVGGDVDVIHTEEANDLLAEERWEPPKTLRINAGLRVSIGALLF